jgi:O-antigen/teichoic acid export membrane protein
MEKELQFKVLTFIEVVESLVYYLLILFLAFHGYEIWSFIYATALKEFVGLAMLMKMSKWRFSVNFDMKTFKGLLKVGLPYQAGAVTNFLSISFPALVIGSYIGQKELGYVSWAHNISLQLIFFATVLDRLWVPTYAKVQNNLKEFLKTVKKTLRFNILTIFPLTIIFFIFAQEITRDIFGQDWVPAAYLLYFYLVACLFSAIGFPIGNAFNALGETRRTFWLSLSWAVIIWGIGMPLTLLFGLTGWGWTYISVQLPYFFMFWYFSRRFNFSIWNTVRAPLFMFFLSFFLTLLMKITLPVTAPFIWISYGVFGVISYFAGLHFIFKDGFLLELKSFWESIRVKDIF